MPALLIAVAVAVVAGIQPGLALAQEDDLFTGPCSGAAGDNDRFELCNACRPMELVVENLNKDAKAIGLTRDRLQVTAESRLRAARLYTDSMSESNLANLYVRVTVAGPAFGVDVQYKKRLFDPVNGSGGIATTWQSSSTGTHGKNSGFIIQSVSEKLDKFLVEYLRVNEKDCPR